MNAATTRRQWRLDEAIDGYIRHGAGGIVPWRDQVLDVGIARASRMLRDAGLPVTGYCRGGMFPAETPAGRAKAIEQNRRMIADLAQLGGRVLVLVCGGLPESGRDLAGARAMVSEGLAAILEDARDAGVRLAIEPLHPMYAADRSCINTLAQANELCETLEPNGPDVLGVAVDAYHVWWDPDLADGIRRAGSARLLGFHLCDWLVPTTDLLNDRGMMGDGVIDLPLLANMMEDAGLQELAEVEIFSDRWWEADPDDLTKLCLARATPIIKRLSSHSHDPSTSEPT